MAALPGIQELLRELYNKWRQTGEPVQQSVRLARGVEIPISVDFLQMLARLKFPGNGLTLQIAESQCPLVVDRRSMHVRYEVSCAGGVDTNNLDRAVGPLMQQLRLQLERHAAGVNGTSGTSWTFLVHASHSQVEIIKKARVVLAGSCGDRTLDIRTSLEQCWFITGRTSHDWELFDSQSQGELETAYQRYCEGDPISAEQDVAINADLYGGFLSDTAAENHRVKFMIMETESRAVKHPILIRRFQYDPTAGPPPRRRPWLPFKLDAIKGRIDNVTVVSWVSLGVGILALIVGTTAACGYSPRRRAENPSATRKDDFSESTGRGCAARSAGARDADMQLLADALADMYVVPTAGPVVAARRGQDEGEIEMAASSFDNVVFD